MINDKPQMSLFDHVDQWWEPYWEDMPEYLNDDQGSEFKVLINFESREALDTFSKLIGQNLTYKTRSIWFPKKESNATTEIYVDKLPNNG